MRLVARLPGPGRGSYCRWYTLLGDEDARANDVVGAAGCGRGFLPLRTGPVAGGSVVRCPSRPRLGAGWRLLFDGKSTDGWRGYHMDSMPSGWQAVDGALTRVGEGRDIITRDQFADFELTLEWKVAPGGQ